jgi:Mn2+/Fe2+ NRAMP family transporter
MKRITGRLNAVLFWSVISAAFIGPGTITTAAGAGAGFGLQLLWALTFSVLACFVLQEAAARLTILSGKSLGQHLAVHYNKVVHYSVAVAIVFGCAAYQAGNITGALVGLQTVLPLDKRIIVAAITLSASLLLWFGNHQQIARLLGIIVALMGLMFFVVAVQTEETVGALIVHLIVPRMPVGGSFILMGLIGTTIVPYNLFLGSGISQGQPLGHMRTGLAWAIAIGGIISVSVLVTGAGIAGDFTFQRLTSKIENDLGTWSVYLFAGGLFAAGFTSALTAPLAAAITFESISGKKQQFVRSRKSYRLVWIVVMAVGTIFSLLGIKPIPMIILAQVLNGFILPFVAVFLILCLSKEVCKSTHRRLSILQRSLFVAVVFVCVLLGLESLSKALLPAMEFYSEGFAFVVKLSISALTGLYLFREISTGDCSAGL